MSHRRFVSCFLVVFGVALFFGLPSTAHSTIYSFTDSNGVVHFTNMPVGGKFRPVNARRNSTLSTPSINPNRLAEPYKKTIVEASNKYGVHEDLIKAVILAESLYNPFAVSRKGAKGLMQLMPSTARDMNVKDAFDPVQNINGGTRYLKGLMSKYQGDLTLSLAAYNSGPTVVDRNGGIPPIAETEDYVEKVIHYFRWYQTLNR